MTLANSVGLVLISGGSRFFRTIGRTLYTDLEAVSVAAVVVGVAAPDAVGSAVDFDVGVAAGANVTF